MSTTSFSIANILRKEENLNSSYSVQRSINSEKKNRFSVLNIKIKCKYAIGFQNLTKYSKISHTHSSEQGIPYKAKKLKLCHFLLHFYCSKNIIWHHFIQPEHQSFILTVSHSDLFKTKRA